MPIKPENRHRYPEKCAEIRAQILERAGHRCEKCCVPDRVVIQRGQGEDSGTYRTENGDVFGEEHGQYLGRARAGDYDGRPVKIVLTIGHLDHVPEHCEPGNLRAWCQRCHLRYDSAFHAQNARETRRNRQAVADLFGT